MDNFESSPSPLSFSISSSKLFKEVSVLSRVVSTNPVMPILSNLLLDIKKGQLAITASDLQTSAVTTLAVQATAEASIAVPATILIETLRNLPDQPITLAVDLTNYSITISAANGKYRIACENAADFPSVPAPGIQQASKMPLKLLKKAIRQTVFATRKDEGRPALEGVNINIDDSGTTFVAIDGHRLVRYLLKGIKRAEAQQVTLSAKSLQLMTQIFPDGDEEVSFLIESQHAFFWTAHIQVIITIINDAYPDYENILPANNPHKLVIATEALYNALKINSCYVNQATQQVLLSLSEDKLELDAEDRQFSNQAHTHLPCTYESKAMKTVVSASLLLEMLSHMPAKQTALLLDTPQSGIVLQPHAAADQAEELAMLIMPLVFQGE